jgi:hypothetical protein
MSDPAPELELRPKPLGRAMFRYFHETEQQVRERLLKVALPAAGGLVLVQGVRSYRSAQEDGVARELLLLGTALAVVAVIVAVMFLAHVRQRITVEGDDLVVRTLARTRRHPRARAHRAVSVQLHEMSHLAPATFLLDPDGRCLVALSWQHWDRDVIERLLGHLGVAHDEQLHEIVSVRQMRHRFPGAFTFSRRRPVATGCLGAVVVVALAIPVAVLLAS